MTGVSSVPGNIPSGAPAVGLFNAFNCANGELKSLEYNPFVVKHRRRTTKDQFKVLEQEFIRNQKPNATVRYQIASALNMSPRSVQVWFQNRRAKTKTKAEAAAAAAAAAQGENSDSEERSPSPNRAPSRTMSTPSLNFNEIPASINVDYSDSPSSAIKAEESFYADAYGFSDVLSSDQLTDMSQQGSFDTLPGLPQASASVRRPTGSRRRASTPGIMNSSILQNQTSPFSTRVGRASPASASAVSISGPAGITRRVAPNKRSSMPAVSLDSIFMTNSASQASLAGLPDLFAAATTASTGALNSNNNGHGGNQPDNGDETGALNTAELYALLAQRLPQEAFSSLVSNGVPSDALPWSPPASDFNSLASTFASQLSGWNSPGGIHSAIPGLTADQVLPSPTLAQLPTPYSSRSSASGASGGNGPVPPNGGNQDPNAMAAVAASRRTRSVSCPNVGVNLNGGELPYGFNQTTPLSFANPVTPIFTFAPSPSVTRQTPAIASPSQSNNESVCVLTADFVNSLSLGPGSTSASASAVTQNGLPKPEEVGSKEQRINNSIRSPGTVMIAIGEEEGMDVDMNKGLGASAPTSRVRRLLSAGNIGHFAIQKMKSSPSLGMPPNSIASGRNKSISESLSMVSSPAATVSATVGVPPMRRTRSVTVVDQSSARTPLHDIPETTGVNFESSFDAANMWGGVHGGSLTQLGVGSGNGAGESFSPLSSTPHLPRSLSAQSFMSTPDELLLRTASGAFLGSESEQQMMAQIASLNGFFLENGEDDEEDDGFDHERASQILQATLHAEQQQQQQQQQHQHQHLQQLQQLQQLRQLQQEQHEQSLNTLSDQQAVVAALAGWNPHGRLSHDAMMMEGLNQQHQQQQQQQQQVQAQIHHSDVQGLLGSFGMNLELVGGVDPLQHLGGAGHEGNWSGQGGNFGNATASMRRHSTPVFSSGGMMSLGRGGAAIGGNESKALGHVGSGSVSSASASTSLSSTSSLFRGTLGNESVKASRKHDGGKEEGLELIVEDGDGQEHSGDGILLDDVGMMVEQSPILGTSNIGFGTSLAGEADMYAHLVGMDGGMIAMEGIRRGAGW